MDNRAVARDGTDTITDPLSPDIHDHVELRLMELHRFAEMCKSTLNVAQREREAHSNEAGKLKGQIAHLKGPTYTTLGPPFM